MRIGDYDTHPAADGMPMIVGKEFDALVEDIRRNGLVDPVVLYDGKILDGRNRYMACLEAGVSPRFTTWDASTNDGNPWRFVWSSNGPRRHLSAGQQAALFVQFESNASEWDAARKHVAEEANRKRSEALSKKPGKSATVTPNIGSDLPTTHSKPTVKAQAAAAGVSTGTLEKAQRLHRVAPEKARDVVEGKVSLDEALKQTKPSAEPVSGGAFAEVPRIKSIVAQLRSASKAWGEFMASIESRQDMAPTIKNGGFVQSMIKSVEEAILKTATPHAVCSNCDGSGCSACDHSGWITASQEASFARMGACQQNNQQEVAS